jgi:hypothetical protein
LLANGLTPVFAIDIEFDSVGAGIIEDAVLVASAGGACSRQSVALGSLDLAGAKHVFDFKLAPELKVEIGGEPSFARLTRRVAV